MIYWLAVAADQEYIDSDGNRTPVAYAGKCSTLPAAKRAARSHAKNFQSKGYITYVSQSGFLQCVEENRYGIIGKWAEVCYVPGSHRLYPVPDMDTDSDVGKMLAEEQKAQKAETPSEFVCPRCGHNRFFAHQACSHDVIVDGNGNFEEDRGIYDSSNPYGPFTCEKCDYEILKLGNPKQL